MRFFCWLVLYGLLPAMLWGQTTTISGSVTRADDHSPLPGASVYLSNSSYGTATADDGTFTLNNIKPGQYVLVASILGLESFNQAVLVNNDPIKLTIRLKPKTTQLKEVDISVISDANRRLYYGQFKGLFLGTDDYAGDCKIINPQVLNFHFHKAENVLNASTDEFLLIENKALGYRIKYLLDDFAINNITGIMTYSGQPVFEELHGTLPQTKKWQKKRKECFYGSPMHFYRSLYNNSFAAQGFELYRLTRHLKPTDESPKTNLQTSRGTVTDVIQLSSSVYVNENISNTQLLYNDILRRTNQPGVYALTFTGCLYVVYTKKTDHNFYKDVYKPAGNNYETTVVSLTDKLRIALFDRNGTIISPNLLYEGTWTKARLSHLLPVDYEPEK